jgi:hypothetical protein
MNQSEFEAHLEIHNNEMHIGRALPKCEECHKEVDTGDDLCADCVEQLIEAEDFKKIHPDGRHEWGGGNEEYSNTYCIWCGEDGDA